MSRRRLRRLCWSVAPSLIAARDRRYQQQLRERLGFPACALEWAEAHGDRVAAGPLAGLCYPVSLLRQADAPLSKLQGHYERPLHAALVAVIDALRARPGTAFVDLGCADGYYAAGVGLAAGCAVEAFDLARSARRATRALAAANGVGVRIHGRATQRALLAVASRTGALLCDIEGAETEVMTPRVAAALTRAVVIVELHGAEARLALPARFQPTHEVEVLDSDPAAGEELRTAPTSWLVAVPRRRL